MEHFRLGLSALCHVLDNDDSASVRHWVSSHLELASVVEFQVEGAAFLRQPRSAPRDKLASERFSKLRQPDVANELRKRDIELYHLYSCTENLCRSPVGDNHLS